jgi:luciferase family oxidoreductase group 1
MPPETPIRLSVLDLSPVPAGFTSADALRNTLDLAQYVDRLGYHRYWLAEHHNMALIATSAPEIMIGHVASLTRRLRVGSGGVMLPNHAPLKVAETFRMLEALHPGRIDLGLGRAPGTDPRTALALRRSGDAQRLAVDDFPEQLSQLQGFLTDSLPEGHPFRTIIAMPDGVPPPELWLLGSSDFGARLAAERGLAFAFAHHIHPDPGIAMLQHYRRNFRPSAMLAEPQALLATGVICAETDEEAHRLASSAYLNMLRFLQGKRPAPLAPVEEAAAYPFTLLDREALDANRERLTVGSPETVRQRLTRLAAQAGVTEIMVMTMVHDHAARRRSYELLAEAFQLRAE